MKMQMKVSLSEKVGSGYKAGVRLEILSLKSQGPMIGGFLEGEQREAIQKETLA